MQTYYDELEFRLLVGHEGAVISEKYFQYNLLYDLSQGFQMGEVAQ